MPEQNTKKKKKKVREINPYFPQMGYQEPGLSDTAKGMIAGAIGGLVATGVKTLAEDFFPPRAPEADSPPVKLANNVKKAVTGSKLSKKNEQVAEQSIHWLFGTAAGAAYGAAVEEKPGLADPLGISFSSVLYAATHGVTLPMLGLEKSLLEQKPDRALNELITHLFYGFTVEVIRRQVRKFL